jgi:hypothetical protein
VLYGFIVELALLTILDYLETKIEVLGCIIQLPQHTIQLFILLFFKYALFILPLNDPEEISYLNSYIIYYELVLFEFVCVFAFNDFKVLGTF